MSSESESSGSEIEEVQQKEDSGLTLNEMNDMIKDYEKQKKKERKLRVDRNDNIGGVIIDKEELMNTVELTRRQLKQLKPKKERTPRQQEATKRIVDLRKKKAEEDRIEKENLEKVLLKVREHNKRKPRTTKNYKAEREKAEKELAELEADEEEEEVEVKPRRFQAKKPNLDEEVEEKVQKINKINNLLETNPYYAQILKSRGVKF